MPTADEVMTPIEIRERYALRNYSVMNVLQYFADDTLHSELREYVAPIRNLAFSMVDNIKDGPELTIALRRLLDAKESFCRHYLMIHNFQLSPIPVEVTDGA